MQTTTAPTMTSMINDLGTVVTAVMGYVVDVAATITTTPILLMTTGILILGGAIGIFGRMLSRG